MFAFAFGAALLAVIPSFGSPAETESARDGFFDSNGVRIHYREWGTGDPVVLIHGYAMNLRRWDVLVPERLAKVGYRVIAVDCRGHGQSGKPHDPASYGAEMARDVVRLLDHLNLERAHVVGYSMGGMITNRLRELHPERLYTATLGGSGWMEKGGYALADLTGADIADALDKTGSFEGMLRRFSRNQNPPPTEEEIRARNERMVQGNDLKALSAVMRAWDGFGVSEENLRQNRVPTLALVGGNDPLKERVDALKAVMSRLEVVVIEGADHGALAHPAFIEKLKDFLNRHRASETSGMAVESQLHLAILVRSSCVSISRP